MSAGEHEDSEVDEDESSAALSTDDDENEVCQTTTAMWSQASCHQHHHQPFMCWPYSSITMPHAHLQNGCEDDQVQKENAVPLGYAGIQTNVKRQKRHGVVKKSMSNCGESGALGTAVSKDSDATMQPTPAAAPKVKKRRTRQNSMPDGIHAEATVTLRDAQLVAPPKSSSTAAKAEVPKKESKKPDQKKASKRSRQEALHSEQAQQSADLPSSTSTAKASPKKAKKSQRAPEPINSHNDTEVAKVESNLKRASKRRSKGAAAKTRQQPRRLSGGSAASQGLSSIMSAAA